MSPDDIDSLALGAFDLLADMGYALEENDEWDELKNFLYSRLEPFVTRDRNYN